MKKIGKFTKLRIWRQRNRNANQLIAAADGHLLRRSRRQTCFCQFECSDNVLLLFGIVDVYWHALKLRIWDDNDTEL